ncbi:MAG: hypothetical protein E7164_00915 [Firmicutes bacterium]|nr:hypothetical protein [Bacillota bacterium]
MLNIMTKLFLIKNFHTFQGEKKLKKTKKYFEGWYYKISSSLFDIAFIPGINITKKIPNAFIQVITNKESYFIKYDIENFEYRLNPFYIKIGNNIFTEDYIHVDIKNKSLKIFGNVDFSNSQKIKVSIINPSIMGPFSYLSFLECNHDILSMKSLANGTIKINNKQISLKDNIAYIEKDYGTSFPKNYIWCQANNFINPKVSFMFSIARIPFKIFAFTGLICLLKVDNVEYKFTTYNGAKILERKITKDHIKIKLKKGKMILIVKINNLDGNKLIAPFKGNMNKEIIETLNANTEIILKENDIIIFQGISLNSGLEIVT